MSGCGLKKIKMIIGLKYGQQRLTTARTPKIANWGIKNEYFKY